MNRDKQIEEMAYEMTQYKETVCKRIEDNKCLLTFHTNAFVNCHFCKLAEHLITEKGYRKANEVAREIMQEVRQTLLNMILANSIGESYDIETRFAEIEKKYTGISKEITEGGECL